MTAIVALVKNTLKNKTISKNASTIGQMIQAVYAQSSTITKLQD